jgi:hypothetical protein
MNTAFGSRRVLQLGLALTLGVIAVSTQAQTRSVRPVPPRQAPPLAIGAVGPGAPNPAGLPSPIPNPAGLTSPFPAGLPPPADTSAATAPANNPTTAPPIIVGGVRVPASDGVAPQTAVMGYGAPAGPLPYVVGSGPYTALQIAQSFLAADANRDGELTRAEAQHLTIMPYSFEEMDRNHDGILTRFEYEDAMH